MTADVIREKYLNFFKSKKHRIVASDSLVPRDDPTVLFTPAGMNQFKQEFLGAVTDFTRATTAQRCLRTDDLDKVGKTRGHHTFFEMMGNFSFGDYFKKEAIPWAWEFLTAELKMPQARLWVSVYKDDDEAYEIWRNVVKFPAEKIVRLGDKDNFWPSEAKEKGPNGPCGPCSEIFFDQGKDVGCGKPDCNPACECGRFLEIWNLVFTQFNRKEGGILEPLPQKNIDTGMGLERMTAVMQGAPNNFETDLFAPLLKEIVSGAGNTHCDKAFVYAVADHLRAVVFAIYDGVLPSNEGRGYVVRKLIRKASFHLKTLGFKGPFLYKLVPVLAEIMKKPYPELTGRRENIAGMILAEEKNYLLSLGSGEALFKEKFAGFKEKQNPAVVGGIAFQLYDTYGIPFELTKAWLDQHGIGVSEVAYKAQLDDQKNRSKLQSNMKGDVFDAKALHLDLKATDFVGYAHSEAKAKVIKIIKDGQPVKKAVKGETVSIILDKTPFYAESGGQVGDTGKIVRAKNIFEVSDTQKAGKVCVHIGTVKEGAFKASDAVNAVIDLERRLAIARNHTATHLLQSALRTVLGEHVKQQGSLVAPERLRFDFTHFKNISGEELNRIEEEVNRKIMADLDLETKQSTLTQAKKSGALAFFGEKYGDRVRVVSIADVSSELCGGSHLESTGQIGFFRISSEGSVASGVRRIEALTGEGAYRQVKSQDELIGEAASIIGASADRLIPELKKLLAQKKDLEKKIESIQAKDARIKVGSLQAKAVVNGVNIFTEKINGDIKNLRITYDEIKNNNPSNTAIFLLADTGQYVIGLTQDLPHRGIQAPKISANLTSAVGGSGGGRPDFVQGGGISFDKFDIASEIFIKFISVGDNK